MLFIFCVGVEAGPNFFSIFFRDGKNYLMLALVMVGSALVIALGLGKLFGWDIGLTAGMLAGSMTSTPVLVGAGDTLRHFGMESRQLSLALDNLSLGYALTYLIGLVSLIVGARYPGWEGTFSLKALLGVACIMSGLMLIFLPTTKQRY